MEQTLGKRIVNHRKHLGMTQDQLAEKLGVTAQAVSKWENDLSCPDISVLPRLADIFGISTDELLGHTFTGNSTASASSDCAASQAPKEHLIMNDCQKGGLGLAVLVLLVGAVYLLSSLFCLGLSFWEILWPCALLVFGIFGLIPRFSFLSLGCTLLGGYFLVSKLFSLHIQLEGGIVWSILILLFGISLLADILYKRHHPDCSDTTSGNAAEHHRSKQSFQMDAQSFSYDACFCEDRRDVPLALLSHGNVSVSFGEFTVDLTTVESLAEDCTINASCSFGELKLLVPKRIKINPDSSTAFAAFRVVGTPAADANATIHLHGKVSFGEMQIIYV